MYADVPTASQIDFSNVTNAKILFSGRSLPRPAGAAYSAPSDSWLYLGIKERICWKMRRHGTRQKKWVGREKGRGGAPFNIIFSATPLWVTEMTTEKICPHLHPMNRLQSTSVVCLNY